MISALICQAMLSQAPRSGLYEALEKGNITPEALSRALIDGVRGPDLNTESADYDVVVIGAGIVGSSFAAVLRELRPGARILVVDQERVGSQVFGKHGEFYAMTTPSLPAQDDNYVPGGPLQVSEYSLTPAPFPVQMNVAGLAALDHSGADVLWNHRVEHIERHRGAGQHYEVRFARGTSVQARVVVAAIGQGPLNFALFDGPTTAWLPQALREGRQGLLTFDALAAQALADQKAGIDPRARYRGRRVVVLGRGVVSGKAADFLGVTPTTAHSVTPQAEDNGYLVDGTPADIVVLCTGAVRDQSHLYAHWTGEAQGSLQPVFGVEAGRTADIIAKRWIPVEGAGSNFFVLGVAAGYDYAPTALLKDMLPRAEALASEVAAQLAAAAGEGAGVEPPSVAEQRVVLERLLSEGRASEAPHAVFFAGIPGAGKSSLLRRMREVGTFTLSEYVVLDPDRVRTIFTSYHRALATDPMHAGNITHDAATAMQVHLVQGYLAAGKSFIVDSTMRNGDFFENLLSDIRASFPRYRVSVVVVDCDPVVATRRIAQRAAATGRMLPDLNMSAFSAQVESTIARVQPFAHEVIRISGE